MWGYQQARFAKWESEGDREQEDPRKFDSISPQSVQRSILGSKDWNQGTSSTTDPTHSQSHGARIPRSVEMADSVEHRNGEYMAGPERTERVPCTR